MVFTQISMKKTNCVHGYNQFHFIIKYLILDIILTVCSLLTYANAPNISATMTTVPMTPFSVTAGSFVWMALNCNEYQCTFEGNTTIPTTLGKFSLKFETDLIWN